MKIKKVYIESPLYFKCPVTGEVIIDEENEVSNVPSNTTEFIYYDGEFEFKKVWVANEFKGDFSDFIKLEIKSSENVVCYEVTWGSGVSLDRVYVGIKK
ncbi:hypothetical protein [Olleya sp. HaHaR_3_96]|uniref:hypothetical protein n=1 Tax=Olleya sp. HaHaR_3_96 TaxID=2745560 RepID=UPI001C4F0A64|nr:hypothetical protein [Olleya sp. HaHaR_3_96]QXP58423.1 hypothetical protein H0I26_10875 [Olleya sp. HaHaR_3_96]